MQTTEVKEKSQREASGSHQTIKPKTPIADVHTHTPKGAPRRKSTSDKIEMTNDTPLIDAGEKVTASQAALLQKLNIDP